VHLSVGSAPRVARFYRGRDVVAWLEDMGYYRKAISDFTDVDAVRFRANHYVTGRDGGRDIDLRKFAREGMRLYGRLASIQARGAGACLTFAPDLRRNLDAADATSEGIKDSIDAYLDATGIDAPPESRYTPLWEPGIEPDELDLRAAGISAVVWSTGFGRDHRWIEIPVFDGRGYPTHLRGITSCPGLYFIGLPWQHTWGSGRLGGVGADAEYLARQIASFGHRQEVAWIAGTPASTYPRDEDWVAPRTVA
jgi:putative flavoprotein involved in K+ transport